MLSMVATLRRAWSRESASAFGGLAVYPAVQGDGVNLLYKCQCLTEFSENLSEIMQASDFSGPPLPEFRFVPT